MKKLIALVLALVLSFALCMPAFAAEETTEVVAYDGDPIVVVRGIDFAGLVKADGSSAISIDAFDVLGLIFNIGGHKVTGNKAAGAHAIASFGKDLFADLMVDQNGNSLSDVSIPKFYDCGADLDLSDDSKWADTAVGLFRSLTRKYGGENVYLYTFDWRMSPDALADDLNNYFEMVKEKTGAEKLDVAACSMGGMVTTAYIEKYGYGIFDSLVFFSPALNGVDVVGSAFTGDLTISGQDLTEFLIKKVGGNFFVNAIIKVLDFIGIIDGISNFVNDILADYGDIIYDEFLCEVFRTTYGLWGMVPDEYFDDAVKFFFEGVEDEYAEALDIINNDIKPFVMSTEEIIDEVAASDVKLSFVSHYNNKQLPIYSKAYLHGDGVIESARTSFGATFANYGETLTDDQLAGVAAEFISPDGVVNASTARYAESTWIINGAKHVGCKDGSDHTEFAIWLLAQDEQPTVNNATYPRFMKCDANENFIAF
ncbi:MAG: alpha/beta hydrolase [Clostridia bacterium]|nr:alpha/beta hydrolase [Clostridia bacterium]